MKKLIIYIVFFNIVFNNTISVPRDFNTIQQAIDISVNGDTILVSPGTYNENINFIGKSIVLIGEDINTTILNGNQNSSVVTFENNEDSNSILDRFSITNGRSQYGGGIYISNANPKIQNVKIYQNFSEDGGGGGLYCVDSSPNLFNVQIYDNNSNDVGGGIYLKGSSSPVCTKIAIYNNYSKCFFIVKFIINKFEQLIAVILLIFFIFGAIVSFYHVGIEKGFFSESLVCDLKISNENISKENLLKQLEVSSFVSCKDVTFRFLGLSLATINTVISIILSAIMLKVIKNYGKNK